MSETQIGGSRWDNLKQATHWARVACQTSFVVDDIEVTDYNRFLIEKYKNPTAADIAMQESIRNNRADAQLMGHNKMILERAPKNDYLVNKLEKDYQSNYPKTGKLRKVLIENDRFKLDFIEPKMTSKLQRFIIKLKSII